MRIAVFSLAGMLFLGPGTASADSDLAEPVGGSIEAGIVFTDEQVRIIRAHYEAHGRNNGNGRQKHGGLPPGIAKNLARGKPLPPGIARQVLPEELRRALPPVRDGHEIIIVAGRILLIEIATQVIRDVLSDVLLD